MMTKLHAALFLFFFSAEMSLGAKHESAPRGQRTNLRMMQSTSCVDISAYHEADGPSDTPLDAAQITTWAYPLYETGGTTEIGETEGYCVGLGTDADPAGGAICNFIYVFEGGDAEGTITALDVEDAGETGSSRAITGGTGSYEGATGEITVTYSGGKYVHELHVCT